MSKKLIAFAAMLALALGMTACEKKETSSENASNAVTWETELAFRLAG